MIEKPRILHSVRKEASEVIVTEVGERMQMAVTQPRQTPKGGSVGNRAQGKEPERQSSHAV